MAYLGDPVPLEDLLYRPDASLVRQAVDPQLMSLLNLGGFGFAAWAPGTRDPDTPLTYRVATIPTFDRNLRTLAAKVEAAALVAHVRGVGYDARERVGMQNVHPFLLEGATIALAHNGDLHDFARMRADLQSEIRPELAAMVEGTTDSEWIYALVLSMLDDPFGAVGVEDAAAAVEGAIERLGGLREAHGIGVQSPVNLVLSDGHWLIATRFTFDYGWYPSDESFFGSEREHDFTTLWYAPGGCEGEAENGSGVAPRATTSVVVASEPLTKSFAGWLEAPEYSMLLVAPRDGGGLGVEIRDLGL